MTYYKDFIQGIRDYLKDSDTDATASIGTEMLGRAIKSGVLAIQTLFPESRLDSRGLSKALETVAYTKTTAETKVGGDYPVIPIPDEFIPALEAHVLNWAHGRDSRDVKDESLARHWFNRWVDLTGQKRL